MSTPIIVNPSHSTIVVEGDAKHANVVVQQDKHVISNNPQQSAETIIVGEGVDYERIENMIEDSITAIPQEDIISLFE